MQPPLFKVCNSQLEKALSHVVWSHSWAGSEQKVGLKTSRDLFQSQLFCDRISSAFFFRDLTGYFTKALIWLRLLLKVLLKAATVSRHILIKVLAKKPDCFIQGLLWGNTRSLHEFRSSFSSQILSFFPKLPLHVDITSFTGIFYSRLWFKNTHTGRSWADYQTPADLQQLITYS